MNTPADHTSSGPAVALRHNRFATFVFDLFFGRVSPFDLSVCRLVLFGFILWTYAPLDYEWEVYRGSLFEPVGMYQWLPLFSASIIKVMLFTAKIAAAFALVGLFYRPAAIVVALTLPYLIGLGNNFGKVNHSENLIALMIVVFAFASAADALSIDALLRRRQRLPPPDSRWRIQMAGARSMVAHSRDVFFCRSVEASALGLGMGVQR